VPPKERKRFTAPSWEGARLGRRLLGGGIHRTQKMGDEAALVFVKAEKTFLRPHVREKPRALRL